MRRMVGRPPPKRPSTSSSSSSSFSSRPSPDPPPPTIASACAALERAAESFASRQRRKRLRRHGDDALPPGEEREVEEAERTLRLAARHGGHVLGSLHAARAALDLGVDALGRCGEGRSLPALRGWFDHVRGGRRGSGSGSGNGKGSAGGGASAAAVAAAAAASASAGGPQAVLAHWFAGYLRLRDGMVLLTSGECRHPGDAAMVRTARFPSSFGAGRTGRGDGYTTLFGAGGGYSGWGWDEFYDPDLGVRTRLADACLRCAGSRPSRGGWGGNRSKVWERLVGEGAETFEAEMDAHDAGHRAAEDRLEAVRRRFLDGVNEILASSSASASGGRGAGRGSGGRLVMVTTDKFERIELQNAASLGISRLVIERRGDDFRVDDPEGVLPIHWTAATWDAAMGLPEELLPPAVASGGEGTVPAASRQEERSRATGGDPNPKRRRIMDDSESDSDGDGGGNGEDGCNQLENGRPAGPAQLNLGAATGHGQASIASAAVGFKIQVEAIDSELSTGNGNITQIKSSLGVDCEALTRGREDLEEEKKQSTAAAVAEEANAVGIGGVHHAAFAIEDEDDAQRVGELMENVAELRDDIKHLAKALRLIPDSNTEDLWNAREALRERKMTLGIDLLDLHSISTSKADAIGKEVTLTTLNYAESLFSDSLDLISQQFVDFKDATSTEDRHLAALMHQGLLLVRGRTRTNLGISLLERGKFASTQNSWSVRNVGDGLRTKSMPASILVKAIECFRNAMGDAQDLCSKAKQTQSSNDNAKFKPSDNLHDGQILELFAKRRLAEALWHSGRRKEAAKEFEDAALLGDRSSEQSDSATAEQIAMSLERLMERYYSASYLIDHASKAAEKVPMAMMATAGEVLSMVLKGYDAAALVSQSIYKLTEYPKFPLPFSEVKEEYDIIDRKDLLKAKESFQMWWRQRKLAKASSASIGLQPRPEISRLRREFVSRSRLPERAPTSRFTVSNDKRNVSSSKATARQSTSNGSKGFRTHRPRKVPTASASHSVVGTLGFIGDLGGRNVNSEDRYRKWGDDLLNLNRNDEGKFDLPFPCCAPAIPESMR